LPTDSGQAWGDEKTPHATRPEGTPHVVTSGDRDALTRFGSRLRDSLEIGLIWTEDPRSQHFRRFAEALSRLVPNLKVKSERGEADAFPHFQAANAVRYQCVPSGPGLQPFLDCLGWRRQGPPPADPAILKRLDALQAPAFVTVFIAPQCPHCPATVRKLLPLAAAEKGVNLTVVDGELFSETARAAGVRSAPTVVLDDRFRWSGALDVDEFIEMAVNRDPVRLGADSLRSMIEEGGAARVAELMRQANALFPAFIELLRHEKWPVRLGAMVIVEYLAETAPALAARLADPLWERFQEADENVKGDLLHVLGQTGRKDFIPRIAAIAEGGGGEELRAAAAEAVGRLAAAP
jgi:glutaredoxin